VIQMNRRIFLKGTMAGSVLAVAASAGLLVPTRVLAAAWPASAFDAKSVDDALKGLFGTTATVESTAITIKAPLQAENGAVVPITVITSLPGVESIAILVQANERPLITNVVLGAGAEGYYSARMKMSKTSVVKVIAKSGGKLHTASQEIKVTAGGCGG